MQSNLTGHEALPAHGLRVAGVVHAWAQAPLGALHPGPRRHLQDGLAYWPPGEGLGRRLAAHGGLKNLGQGGLTYITLYSIKCTHTIVTHIHYNI